MQDYSAFKIFALKLCTKTPMFFKNDEYRTSKDLISDECFVNNDMVNNSVVSFDEFYKTHLICVK